MRDSPNTLAKIIVFNWTSSQIIYRYQIIQQQQGGSSISSSRDKVFLDTKGQPRAKLNNERGKHWNVTISRGRDTGEQSQSKTGHRQLRRGEYSSY